jgi:type VI protein secretion system component VasK
LRHARIALPLAALTLFLAACNRVDSGQLTFWDLIWSMVVFFIWVMWIFIFISIFMDVFRRNDLSGGWKAIWIIALILIPFLSALIYIIARPKVTAQDVQMAAQAEAANKAVAGVSKADELAKLQALKDAGTINDAQFEDLKAKLLAS